MRLPPCAWRRTLQSLGLLPPARRLKRSVQSRRLPLEHLEPRQMLTADITLNSFTTSADQWHVNYTIPTGSSVSSFNLGFYRSSDGVNPDSGGAVISPVTITVPSSGGTSVSGGTAYTTSAISPSGYSEVSAKAMLLWRRRPMSRAMSNASRAAYF